MRPEKCYSGDSTRLLVLVRGSITHNIMRGVIACLERMGADSVVLLLNIKNCFGPGYEWRMTAEYCKILLLLVVVDVERVRLCSHGPLCTTL